MRNQVQLITYADRLGGNLAGLNELLHGKFDGLFGGVHLLPFYTPFDGADAGFDPADHTQVDPRLGSWEDVRTIAQTHDVMADVIVNHVSHESPQFLDWLAKGEASEFADMFLTLDRVFPDGVNEENLLKIYRPRPNVPLTYYTAADGSKHALWTTFTPQQIDIDVKSATGEAYLLSILDSLHRSHASSVRLDAVGYAIKKPGTTSFMIPETFSFIDDISRWCKERGLEVLVEVHSYYKRQIEIAQQVDRVYDFALPPLTLFALITGDPRPLHDWLQVRPSNAINVLDTHDGIGVIDVGPDATDRSQPGLLTPEQIDTLVESMHDNSGGSSRLATGAAASNLDLYQVNSTYYEALGRDDAKYLVARAIQFFTPGIPQVYYVGLLAGVNDMDLLKKSGVGRDVNRHHYSLAEITEQMERPVVKALFALIKLRNTHAAFSGEFTSSIEGSELSLQWVSDSHSATLIADVAQGDARLIWSTPVGERSIQSLVELAN